MVGFSLPLKCISDCSWQKQIFVDDVSATRTDWVFGHWQKEYFLEVPLFVFHLYCAFVFRVMIVFQIGIS